ncbi:MAG: hypothetical protein H6867_07750 [Rhodospirillales bacterium]|nr:hypothetical protein [Rhodospirillales bacterium]MCB9995446.1 hypothetical protein [Rhodospirillales bacterium]
MKVAKDAQNVASGLKGLFRALVLTAATATIVHDVWTGESLISKTWNSAVAGPMKTTEMCRENQALGDSFICKKRGNGKGLDTLIPKFD